MLIDLSICTLSPYSANPSVPFSTFLYPSVPFCTLHYLSVLFFNILHLRIERKIEMLVGVELEAAENSAREHFSGMIRNAYLVHAHSQFGRRILRSSSLSI